MIIITQTYANGGTASRGTSYRHFERIYESDGTDLGELAVFDPQRSTVVLDNIPMPRGGSVTIEERE